MSAGRTLLLAVDGLAAEDVGALRGLMPAAHTLRILPGGPSEPDPVLTSLVTGTSVARAGVPTQERFRPEDPDDRAAWYAEDLRAPTLLSRAQQAGLRTAALQWPATAGGDIALCLPLVEDLRRYRHRWEMAERTSSPRMVAEHLAPRREAGVQLSQVDPDDLVTEIAVDALGRERLELLAARLAGPGRARRRAGIADPEAERALEDVEDLIDQLLTAFAPTAEDRVLLVPGRPLVPTRVLVHPNVALAARALLRTDGPRLASFRAVVRPDGSRGVVHVRREEGAGVRAAVLAALTAFGDSAPVQLRTVDDGEGATPHTDVIAVLEGEPGTVFGLSATARPLVPGDDPYSAGPRAVADPAAESAVLAQGPGLPPAAAEGSWADLGVSLAAALGVDLPGATAAGMHAPAATASA
ncbi:alkaline phosphatase family protein [Brachybacterium saurashtrense]|uniref:Phosphodiesterase n=1 Tax=Brachybacterium saurashtrense TaxID=556288 RepID=A0A345YSK6_9MICO|nr:alkaline phosphatase family protein [Brachybacterium saurashtrense]AXK46908.1 phosphodiesterase [Brachybacterium saurashtrense]RRR22623.1 phosphodiesterase [Brachybacterium saurashtrense]